MKNFPGVFKAGILDITPLGWLPRDWIKQIETVSAKHAVEQFLDGTSSTSREKDLGTRSMTRIVTGDVISETLPWLTALYKGALLEFTSQIAGVSLTHAKDLRSSVNINVLSGIGSRYERHEDSNPFTGLLFVTTLKPEDGGALVFDHADGTSDIFTPRSGAFYAFDATKTPHYVSTLKKRRIRISIPMNYYRKGHSQVRPTGLDKYLYGKHT